MSNLLSPLSLTLAVFGGGSQYCFGALDCADLTLEGGISGSDYVVEATVLNAAMGWEEFRDGVGPKVTDVPVSAAYTRYLEEFPYDKIRVSYTYKGKPELQGDILISSRRGSFSPGKTYVLFLAKVTHEHFSMENLYGASDCVWADMEESVLVWNSTYVDRVQFTAFVNQLHFLREHNQLPKSLPKIEYKK